MGNVKLFSDFYQIRNCQRKHYLFEKKLGNLRNQFNTNNFLHHVTTTLKAILATLVLHTLGGLNKCHKYLPTYRLLTLILHLGILVLSYKLLHQLLTVSFIYPIFCLQKWKLPLHAYNLCVIRVGVQTYYVYLNVCVCISYFGILLYASFYWLILCFSSFLLYLLKRKCLKAIRTKEKSRKNNIKNKLCLLFYT